MEGLAEMRKDWVKEPKSRAGAAGGRKGGGNSAGMKKKR
jgi:hypothetical protein